MKNFAAKGRVVAITGGCGGIGLGLARAFLAAGARAVAVSDVDHGAAECLRAKEPGLDVATVNSAEPGQIQGWVDEVIARHGRIDLYCSNAGILQTDAPDWQFLSRSVDDWRLGLEVNIMAHVYGCQAVLPPMLARGDGAVMITASAAGLLSQIGSAIYSTTKHGAVGLAESLSITHGDDGIYVSALCPQAIRTDMLNGLENSSAAVDGALEVDELAAATLESLARGEFMIRPHAGVENYFRAKAENYDRWVGGMRKLRRLQQERTGRPI